MVSTPHLWLLLSAPSSTKEGHALDVSCWAEHPQSLNILATVGLNVNHTLLCGLTDALTDVSRETSLEVNSVLILCPFSRVFILESFLRLVTSLATGPQTGASYGFHLEGQAFNSVRK